MKKTLLILAMLTSALLAGACSASAPKLTDAGNEAFTQEAYDEALQAYQEAQVKSPELAEPYYNAANALYRQGNYEEALKQLQKALQVSESDALAQNAHFNAGNAAFNGEDWQAAVDDYTAALLRNPDDQDAKVNLELALQKLQEQQQQQQ
ncbi:MAG: tetratricopeptide repeat protein, partial [Anaerolineae bacterium]|nr:tetratricopeptide repeat protein [Anaerolineae bacterium]